MMILCVHEGSRSSSSSDTNDDSNEPSEAAMEDAFQILGLLKKDYM